MARAYSTALRQRRSEELRKQLIAQTIKILAKDGLRESTTAEVARRAGVSESTVFWHFGSKEGLLKEVVLELLGRLDFRTDPRIFDSSLSARERLIAMVDCLVDSARRQATDLWASTVLFTDNTLMKKIRPELTMLIRERRRLLRDLVNEAVERGEIEPISPTVFGEFLSGAAQGIHVHLRHHAAGYDPEPMYRALRRAGLALLGLGEAGNRLVQQPMRGEDGAD